MRRVATSRSESRSREHLELLGRMEQVLTEIAEVRSIQLLTKSQLADLTTMQREMAMNMRQLAGMRQKDHRSSGMMPGAHAGLSSGFSSIDRRSVVPSRLSVEDFAELAELHTLQQDRELPAGWPATLKVRTGLDIDVRSNRRRLFAAGMTASMSAQAEGSMEEAEVREPAKAPGPGDSAVLLRILDPDTRARRIYNFGCLLVLIRDLIITPYVLAWDLPLQGPRRLLAWAVLVFWTLDFGMCFFTGFYNAGEVEKRQGAIARHYLRTWCLPDLLILLCDWVSLLLGSQGRAIRAFTLLRVLRLFRILRDILDRSLTDSVHRLAEGIALFFSILWTAHLLCCVFYLVGRLAPSDTDRHWISALSGPSADDARDAYEYFVALHWSMQQLAAGTMDVAPSNSAERQFNIFVLLFGWLCGNSIVSYIAASMIELRMARHDKTEKLKTLQRYLEQNAVNPEIVLRVRKQVADRMGQDTRLAEADVPTLDLLSSTLRSDLHHEIYRKHLLRYPLFQVWEQMDPTAVQYLSRKVSHMVSFAHGDTIFQPGEQATQAFMVVSGTLQYSQHPGTSMAEEPRVETIVGEGQCICEAALWSEWVHVGTLKAVTDCEMLAIRAHEFVAALPNCRKVRDVTVEYGRHYYAAILQARPPKGSWPNDISVPLTEFSDIVLMMDAGFRRLVSLVALRRRRGSLWSRNYFHSSTGQSMTELEDEVRSGRCAVAVNSAGELERVVTVADLRLEREGNILVQLAQLQDEQLLPVCRLPISELRRGENQGDAVNRVLYELLGPQAENVRPERTWRHWALQDAGVIRTRCLHITHVASVLGYLETPRPSFREVSIMNTLYAGDDAALSEAMLVQHRLQVISCNGSVGLYTWMPPASFEHLSSPAGAEDLRRRLSRISGSSVAALATLESPRRNGVTVPLSWSGATVEYNRLGHLPTLVSEGEEVS